MTEKGSIVVYLGNYEPIQINNEHNENYDVLYNSVKTIFEKEFMDKIVTIALLINIKL